MSKKKGLTKEQKRILAESEKQMKEYMKEQAKKEEFWSDPCWTDETPTYKKFAY